MKFDLPKEQSSIIKVIGVGGGGSNAVNFMYKLGIKGVDFIVCNTDAQALNVSPVPFKIQLGNLLTEGLGAGSKPEMGKNAALETIDEIKQLLSKNTKMIFVTAGLGGGTGTGAAPIIAKTAKEMGILTVGIVTIPFSFEGPRRRKQAEEGLEEMRKSVDTLLVINNDRLRELYGNLKVTDAFQHADNVLTTAAKGIADIITTTLHINTDFADIKTVMQDSGVAIMGSATASGEGRAIKAVEQALASPLLNDSNITGARYVLLNITCGSNEITMDELGEITDYIQEAAGQTAELIKGFGIDETLGDSVNITVIATGFKTGGVGYEPVKEPQKIVRDLEKEQKKTAVVEKVEEKITRDEPVLITKTETKSEQPIIITKEEPIIITKEEPVIESQKAEEPIIITKQEEPIIITNQEPVAEEQPIIITAEDKTEHHDTEETFIDEFDEGAGTFVAETPEVPPVNEVKEEVKEEPLRNEFRSDVKQDKNEEIFSEDEKDEEPYLIIKEKEPKSIELDLPVNKTPAKNDDIKKEEKASEEPVLKSKTEAGDVQKEETVSKSTYNPSDEQKKKAQERIMKLKELSYKMKNPSGLAELENEPAYKRKNIEIDNSQPSSESNVSKYTMSETGEKKIEIRPNNSFLHDNVD